MIPDPVEIQLDKKRKLLFGLGVLRRAETEINKRRGASISQYVNIDYLMIRSAMDQAAGTGGFPLDLLIVMLWAGLSTEDPRITFDSTVDLIEQSPLTRGEIATIVWDAYIATTEKSGEKKESTEDPPDPLPQRPGSSSGVLQ